MVGQWTITDGLNVPIHTFTAPEDGWVVNSHVIEFPSQIFVVDAQYKNSCAREVVRYAGRLGKPMTRLYVTHYHPDHLLGAHEFPAPMYALSAVAEKIRSAGDRVAFEEHEKAGSDVSDRARQVDFELNEGIEVVDGVRVEHRRLRGAETDDALVVALPDQRSIIVQDLIYNHAHVFLGERHFDTWRHGLEAYKALAAEHVLPGHGAPGGPSLYSAMRGYLDYAELALAKSETAPEFRQRMLDEYGDYECEKVLDHQLRFLFR